AARRAPALHAAQNRRRRLLGSRRRITSVVVDLGVTGLERYSPSGFGLASTFSSLVTIAVIVWPASSKPAAPLLSRAHSSTGPPRNLSGFCSPFDAVNFSVAVSSILPEETGCATQPFTSTLIVEHVKFASATPLSAN